MTRVRSAAVLLPLLALPLAQPATAVTGPRDRPPAMASTAWAARGPVTADRPSAAAPERAAAARTTPSPPTPARGPTSAYAAPVPGPAARAFDPPRHRWEPGHRGIDLRADQGSVVTAPGPGVVTFAGPVAGKPVVVITHPDGLRSSLEPVDATVARGTSVRLGDPVGVLRTAPGGSSNPDHCAALPQADTGPVCVHWGVRRGETYLDPLTLLGTAPPIVLLPPR